MRSIGLLVVFLLVFLRYGKSQTVNDIPIREIESEYIQIVGTNKPFTTKNTIEIDFGQHDNVWIFKDTQVKDENGKLMVFNSMVDALNFLSKYGYDFVNAYAISTGSGNVYHYLMRKRKQE